VGCYIAALVFLSDPVNVDNVSYLAAMLTTGNGRPFVMEVVNSYAEPAHREESLRRAVDIVASNTGLNEGGDVELLTLSMVRTWYWQTGSISSCTFLYPL
jgi:hypothetical protein